MRRGLRDAPSGHEGVDAEDIALDREAAPWKARRVLGGEAKGERHVSTLEGRSCGIDEPELVR